MLNLRAGHIGTRTPHRLATTTMFNEVANALNMMNAPLLGAIDPPMFQRAPGLVFVHNDTNYDLSAYSIVGVSDSLLIDPASELADFLDIPHVNGVTTTADHVGKFVILQEDLPIGQNGWGIAVGVSVVKLNVQNANDTHADVAANDRDKLTTGTSGAARILAKESGTGTKWGIVAIGAGAASFFPVLVVWSAGSDGNASNYATWTYNLYAYSDTGHTTPLTAAAVQPENSPARIVKGPVTKAATDSVGQAYRASDGTVHLYTCCEKHGSCT